MNQSADTTYQTKSNCCNAPMRLGVQGEEQAVYYCTKCGKPCDTGGMFYATDTVAEDILEIINSSGVKTRDYLGSICSSDMKAMVKYIDQREQESYNQALRDLAERVKEAVAYRVEEAFTLKYNLHEPENSDYNRGIDDMRAMLDEGLDKVIDEQVTELTKGE